MTRHLCCNYWTNNAFEQNLHLKRDTSKSIKCDAFKITDCDMSIPSAWGNFHYSETQ